MVQRYEKAPRIDQKEISKLAMSARNRDDQLNMTSTKRVIFPDCNMPYWNISSTWTQQHVTKSKKRIGLCNRAQTLRRELLALQIQDMVTQNNSTNVCRNQSSKMNLSFDFTSMIEEYIEEHNPPRLFKDLVLHQLKLCKDRQERDGHKGKKTTIHL